MKRFVSMLLVVVMCITCVPMTVNAQRDISREEILAQELKDLGLFRGVSETDFDLDRAPSRVEALVMLIRVLGKEHEVTSDTWKHPFTDVPSWADNYVGYAYSKGLTNGQSATQFGTGDANAAMYLTFVLRALGYSDTNGKDFAWDNPYTLSRETGILDNSVNINEFWRADVVIVSHKALSSYLNGSQQTLAQKLISAGVFTQSEFDSVYNKGTHVTKPSQSGELTAEEIFANCSPAVFYIETFNSHGDVLVSGSGFFIDDKGTAVTNYHVIEDAYSALIQLSDTEAVHEVLGVYDYNAEEDWAIIKIDCSGNKFLNIDDKSSVVGGAKVYAIGSPLGLQNTISEGIVSNPARVDGGITYIQTNAAISHGSSGGALINKDGNVIGITSAGFEEGQNLNLALPISYIKDHNSTKVHSLISLITGNDNSVIKGYDDYLLVPDFGAFNAVIPLKVESYSGNTTYYYSHEDLKNAGTYTWSLNLYEKMLFDWGFDRVNTTSKDYYLYQYKLETATHTYVVLYSILKQTSETDCQSVTVQCMPKKGATAYAVAPAVPDFGDFFELETISENLDYPTVVISFEYSTYELQSKGVTKKIPDAYWELLEGWGFTFKACEENVYGETNYFFENTEKGVTVGYNYGDLYVRINIFPMIFEY